ncbi:DUF4826 family protein [Psychrosphaera sp. 1_MG-2023]|uniref:DUF4826 family protein n=1 Tax=Psychrosphaera algicola TaxID=3023714 RepID=A0ABT5FC38_9GAMM|nr:MULTISPECIES: DUF4826 family protein [unclassified Psychrosphaera]MDC2888141.1 DUF4826 family protein [Psychrosphaera sp. G1-22]MDO6720171.1 DUF4826 family protein [Psychrosphaera sp. 1_MG-2023]
MSENKTNTLTEEEINQWCKASYQEATKILAQNGIITESVDTKDSRYLPPVIAFWKLKSTDGNQFWVVCGEIKHDFLPVSAANSAREAARSFALRWQIEVEQLVTKQQVETDEAVIEQLKQEAADTNFCADRLYQIFEIESFWG